MGFCYSKWTKMSIALIDQFANEVCLGSCGSRFSPGRHKYPMLCFLEHESANDGNCFFWSFLQGFSGKYDVKKIESQWVLRLRELAELYIREFSESEAAKRYIGSKRADLDHIASHEMEWGGVEECDLLAHILKCIVFIWGKKDQKKLQLLHVSRGCEAVVGCKVIHLLSQEARFDNKRFGHYTCLYGLYESNPVNYDYFCAYQDIENGLACDLSFMNGVYF